MGRDIDWEEFNEGEIPATRVKFENKGDHVAGTVTNVRVTDFGGKGERTPELWIQQDDGTEVSMVASQVMLRRALASHRPKIGDRIAVVYKDDATSSRAGMSPAKLFEVKVIPGGMAAPAAAGTTSAPAAPVSAGVSAESLI
jgi:hypothetical protein